MIITGCGRVLAARKLGMERVPVIVLGHLTERQKRAYVIADNKIALNAEWDLELLRKEVAQAEEELRKLDVFTDQEYEKLLAELERETSAVDEDDIPEIPKTPASMTGDLWNLDTHHLLCGDSILMSSLEKVLAGGNADLAFTDVPYNIAYREAVTKQRPAGPRLITNDNLGKDFYKFLYDACLNIIAVTHGAIYICMSSAELHTLYKAFTDAGGHWSTFLIWSKMAQTDGTAQQPELQANESADS